jgi:hypothetical protein
MPYLNPNTGFIHYGDKQLDEIEIPERPTIFHKWVNDKWEFDRELWLNTEVRPKRNALLDRTDIEFCCAEKWESYTPAEKQAWQDYKKALKDMTKTVTPENLVFPVRPV